MSTPPASTPPPPPIPAETVEAIERHFDEMIAMQRRKVFDRARRHVPHLTADDVLNPHDFPALMRDHDFQFEDGILSGLVQSQISLRAAFFRPSRDRQP